MFVAVRLPARVRAQKMAPKDPKVRYLAPKNKKRGRDTSAAPVIRPEAVSSSAPLPLKPVAKSEIRKRRCKEEQHGREPRANRDTADDRTRYGWSANEEHYTRVLRATSVTSSRDSTAIMAVIPVGECRTADDGFFCYDAFCERKQTELTIHFREWLRAEHDAFVDYYGGTS